MSDKKKKSQKKVIEDLKKKRESKSKEYWLDMPEEKGLEDADFVPPFIPAGLIRKGVRKAVKAGTKAVVSKASKERAKKIASNPPTIDYKKMNKNVNRDKPDNTLSYEYDKFRRNTIKSDKK